MKDYIVKTSDLASICDWTIEDGDETATYRIRDYGNEIRISLNGIDGGDWIDVDTDYETWKADLVALKDADAVTEL